MSDIKFLGMDKMSDDFKRIAEEMPDKTEKAMRSVVNRFKREVVKATPKRSGKLKKSYKIKQQGYGFEKEFLFFSKSPYFHVVERGHKVVSRKGKSLSRNKETTGSETKYVKGVFMVKDTFDKFEKIYPDEIEKAFNKVLQK